MKTRKEKNREFIKRVFAQAKYIEPIQTVRFYLDKQKILRFTYAVKELHFPVQEMVTRKGIKQFLQREKYEPYYISYYYNKEDKDNLQLVLRLHYGEVATFDNTIVYSQYLTKKYKSGNYTIQELINKGFSEEALHKQFYSVYVQQQQNDRLEEIEKLLNDKIKEMKTRYDKAKPSSRKKVNPYLKVLTQDDKLSTKKDLFGIRKDRKY